MDPAPIHSNNCHSAKCINELIKNKNIVKCVSYPKWHSLIPSSLVPFVQICIQCASKGEAVHCTVQSASAVEETSCCCCSTGGYQATKQLPNVSFDFQNLGEMGMKKVCFIVSRQINTRVCQPVRWPCVYPSGRTQKNAKYIIENYDIKD